MIAPAVAVAFLLGLVLEAAVIVTLDRRAIRREAAYWNELRGARDGDGSVFDWEAECAEFGCHEPEAS